MAYSLFVTNIDRQYTMMRETGRQLAAESRLPEAGRVLFFQEEDAWNDAVRQNMAGASVVVFSWMGVSRDTRALKQMFAYLTGRGTPYVVLASDADLQKEALGVTAEQQRIIRTYFLYSGRANFRNLWLWLATEFGGAALEYRQPQPVRWNGVYHPKAEEPFENTKDYMSKFCRLDRTTVGILFPRDEWVWGDLAYPDRMIEELETMGLNVIAVFSHWARTGMGVPGVDDTVRSYFRPEGRTVIDVLINTFKFSLTVGRPVDQEFLRELDVPILQAYGLLRPVQEWERSVEGLTPMELSMTVAMPEFDGIIHAVPVAAKEEMPDGSKQYLPIPERLQAVVRRAAKWGRLRRKANQEKKIAIIFHNYPPTNASIGSAVGLDSPASVRLLLAELASRGYRLDHIPEDSKQMMEELLAQATNDRRFLSEQQMETVAGKVSKAEYCAWFDRQESKIRQQLTTDWGEPPGDVFQYNGNLLVPGLLNGNVFISVQPPRGFGEDPGKILHSPDCAPTHHYLAYYHWIRDIWQADAILHIGTHGSLEWLPGKATGQSRCCYPDLAIDDLPNVYPYLITIVGEGIQAKRRGAACLIGHLTPPVSRAETYEELADLEKLLDEYVHFQQQQPGNAAVIEDLIREKAAAAKLDTDIIEVPDKPFSEYAGRLHAYITDLKNMQIRVGLHILGCPPQDEVLLEYLQALTRVENGEIPSLTKTVAAIYGYDYYELLENSAELTEHSGKTGGQLLDEIWQRCREVVAWLQEREFAAGCAAELPLPWVKAAPAELQEKLIAAAGHICRVLVPNLAKTAQEISNLLAALEGCYIEPGPSGAPTGGAADVLPTGRNFYGVDPRTLPTAAAWKIGCQLGDGVITRYIADEGRYPENIGIVVWCGANMRSHGQCIAEFLYLLGIRPVWQKGSQRVIGLEPIPLEELKRPRIDVTARISGLVRDALPDAAALMDKAVSLAASLEEAPENNYVRKHILEDAAALTAAGLDSREAWQQAGYRIFGCPPGTYGAGVGHLLEAKSWETVEDLAQVYVRWGAHAYAQKAAGVFVPELFQKRLGSLEVTVKNEDNREVHMLSSDDFNAYHGGMIAAVRSIRGSAPRSYCGDSSDRQHAQVRSLEEEFKRIFRGEAMNPKFVEGMKQHGYKGAADLAGVVSHCYQWDATSSVMEDWMYDGLAGKYALDKAMQDWMKEVNPWALGRIAETLLEAAQRNLWQPDAATLQELKQIYLDIEGELEAKTDD